MRHEYKLQLFQLDKAAKNTETYNSDVFHRKVKEILNTGSRKDCDELYEVLKNCRYAIQSTKSDNTLTAKGAVRVVESFRHAEKDFRQVVESTKRFAKTCEQSRRDYSLKKQKHQPAMLKLKSGLRLEEIHSLQRLMDYGKVLDNCVREEDTANEYIADVEAETHRLYGLIGTHDQILALIKIDLQTREIKEFQGIERDGVDLFGEIQSRRHRHRFGASQALVSQNDLIDILNLLKVSADSIDEFTQQGAFSTFKQGIPETEPVRLNDGREIWIWKFKNELIVAIDDDSESTRLMNWSRFVRESDYGVFEWSDMRTRDDLSLGKLFELLLNNPQAFEKVCNR